MKDVYIYIMHSFYSTTDIHFFDILRILRSSVSKQMFIPKTTLNIRKRAFSMAAPTIWNQLPIAIKYSETMDTFRKKFKTYLFEIAFQPYNFGSSILKWCFQSADLPSSTAFNLLIF